MKKIFINQKRELRSGWKLLMVSIFTVFLTVVFSYFLNLLNLGGGNFTLFTAMVISVFIMLKFFDKKKPEDLGLIFSKKSIKYFVIGLLSGIIALTLNIFILRWMGLISFVNNIFSPNFSPALWQGLVLFTIVGFAEELIFRGYFIVSLQQMNRSWLSLLISAIIFALLHGGLNNNVSYLAVFNIFLAGLLLGYIFLASKNIFLPIGFHITWNYFQGYIFGIEVSGSKMGESMYTILMKNNYLTGGAFGLEGGLINTFVLTFSIFIFYFYFNHGNNKNIYLNS